MQAWRVSELRGIEALTLVPDAPEPPPPGEGEISVALTAAALNYPDLLMLSGGYQYKPPLPFTPGMEACGRVIAVGEGVSADLLGQRMVVGSRAGTLCERLTLPLRGVRPAPEALNDAEAAAFGVGALTAWVAFERGRLAAGERVLVTGAGGGMGLSAVAVAKALGAEVIAAAGSAAKLAAARAAGADATLLIDRAAPDFADAGALDLVFDPVGGALVPPALKALRWGGRYLVIGFVGGQAEPVPLNRFLLKGIEAIGVRAGEAGRQDPAAGRRHIHAIDALANAGKLHPHIGLSVPLAEAPRAFAAMAAGDLIGKAVVSIG
ncbi:zinc-binding dehydrogenase [Sandaracinobacteroides saxicola]|uniref:Zinc-binding dehydrogenase n=1 Tax=Sandaracinobacteroides saxicola TaxID=2759707 RepID=A0A7G5IKY0_9SPHN|nr:zinc-binding dehydrogenase [Sandaracinobacteroides saxicola]QMW24022.1 zinc-binding dehydrogenase [Sandaracinobacteroides saxicola]